MADTFNILHTDLTKDWTKITFPIAVNNTVEETSITTLYISAETKYCKYYRIE